MQGLPNTAAARAIPIAIVPGIVTWALGAAVFFRKSLFSGFGLVNGDAADGQMITYLHEHLFRWLAGQASFASPTFFYPQLHVLGYTDAFLLDVLPFAGLRLLGADPFLSMQLLAIALSALCFFCTFHIFARQLGLRVSIALAGALLVTFPNNLFFKISGAHVNFLDIYYAPLVVLLALAALRSFPQANARSLAVMVAASALYALLFATSYYIAWLLAFCALIGIAHAGLKFRTEALDLLRDKRRALIAYGAAAAFGFLAGIMPFVVIYLPVLVVHPARDFREYIGHAPFLYDVINVSGSNALWGGLVSLILGAPRAAAAELALAVTPVMSILFIAWATARRRSPALAGSRLRAVFVSSCAALAIWSWLLTIKIGAFSAFWIPFHVIPGGNAIRAGERIQLLCNGFVVAGLLILIDDWLRGAHGRDAVRRGLMAAAILALCLVEQLNVFRGGLDRTATLKALAAVPTPPAACQVVLVANAGQRPLQADAMWIALRAGLPTINGDSGWLPPNWRLSDPRTDYFASARDWIARSALTNTICLYDQATRAWSPFSPAP